MNAHDAFRSMFLRLPTRQLRRSHERQVRGVLERGRGRFAPEVLETRAMMSATMPDYQVVQDWGTGFQAGITLNNQGTTAVNDWKVSFDYSSQISSIWDAKIVSHVGSTYTITNAGWNGTLDPGRSVAFGFVGAGPAAAAPQNWLVNGAPIGSPGPAPLPEITVSGVSVSEGATGGTAQAVFALSLSAPSSMSVSVAYRTADGTATAGSDYTAANGTITFPAGSTRQEIRVPVTGDATVEADETFTLALSAPQGATLKNSTATGTILNDDAPPAGQGVSAVFNVTGKWDTGFQGEIVLKNGGTTAINGWKLGFTAPWGVSSVWNAQLLGKTAVTGGTRFLVGDAGWNAAIPAGGSVSLGFTGTYAGSIATPSDWTLNGVALGGTVAPPPPPPPAAITVTGGSVSEGAAGGTAQAVFALSLSAASSVPVTVAYRTADGTATAGADYTAASGTVTFPAGSTRQEVRVAVTGDATVEPDETFSLVLSAAQNATLKNSTAVATIVNDDTTPTTGDKTIQSFDKVLSAYFPEWGIYGRNFHVADVPGDKLNHLIYSFLDLKSDGTVAITDTYASLEKRFTAAESVSGQADLWSYPSGDPRATQTVWGNFNQLAELKEKYPHMKVSIAVGGWTLSDNFSSVCSTATGREAFATSLVQFLNTYRMFDGIDFDWEYPGGGGEAGNSVSPNDGANYAALLQLVRQKFDALGGQLGRRYEISVASPAGYDKIANFNLPGLAKSVDFFNVMAYDFHGTWENTTGHQSAFTGDSHGYDVKHAVDLYLAAGVPARQIVLGAPLYTRAWSGVADGGDGGLMETSSGAAPGTFEKGVYDYKDLLAQVQDPSTGWKLYWDDTAQAAYVYNKAKGYYSSFETPTSIAQRAQWAEDIGLGGMMFWDITGDALTSKESLVNAAFSSWVRDDDLTVIRSQSALKNEVVIGGDGVITALPPVA